MTIPEAWRESLIMSRSQGTPFPVAWEIATTEHPLEDFMEGYFNEGRDSEGKDFAVWLEQIWAKAYNRLSPAKKPTLLEPSGMPSKAVSVAPVASQTHALANVPKRCRSGDHCDRAPGHGNTGKFCEHHAGELAGIRRRHQLDKMDFDEWSSADYLGGQR